MTRGGLATRPAAAYLGRVSSSATLRLFVKPGCPWCEEAEEWLQTRGIEYQRLNVIQDRAAYAEMVGLTGQTRAPSLEMNGEILADFGADELEVWWAAHGPTPR